MSGFVGYQQEFEELRRYLTPARQGQGDIVLLAGESGIGKTRLAEELAALAASEGAQVLWGRCYEGDGAPAFWPWIQILRAIAQGSDAEYLAAQLGQGAAAIGELAPEIRQRLPETAPSQPLDPAAARFHLFQSVADLLSIVSQERFLVLMLDDLHWADVPSLLLLRFLAGPVRQLRLLIVGAYRDLEARHSHPLTPTLAELARNGTGRSIRLAGLAEGDVAHFIQNTVHLAPPADFVAQIARQTNGNPFFIAEIVRLQTAENRSDRGLIQKPWSLRLPASVRATVTLRLSQSSDACRDILTIAAIIGRDFDLEIVAQVSELPRDRLLELLEEAELAGIIAADFDLPGRFRFVHALVREAIYEDLPAARRVRLHRRIGEALESIALAGDQGHLAELAHHFLQAASSGTVDKAIEYAQRAGDRALALLAYEDAAVLYEQALQALEATRPANATRRCELLLALSRARARAGDASGAKEAARRAAGLARDLGRPEYLAQAALGFEGDWATVGVVDHFLVNLLEDALLALDPAENALRARLMARLSLELYWSSEADRAIQLSQSALDLARRAGDPEALAAALRARHYTLQDPSTGAIRLGFAADLLDLAGRSRQRELAARARWMRVVNLLETGDIAGFEAELTAYTALAAELRHPHHQWNTVVAEATRLHLAGHLEESERLARQALELGRRIPNQYVEEAFTGQLFAVRREQGQLNDLLEPLAQLARRSPNLSIWRCGLALAYCRTAQPQEARRTLQEVAADGLARLRRDSLWLPSLALLAEACVELGERRQAREIYDLLAPYACSHVAVSATMYLGSVAHYLALLARTLETPDLAAVHFEDALAIHSRTGARLWLIHTQVGYGELLCAGPRSEANPPASSLLEEALSAAKRLELTDLAARAARVLAAAATVYPDRLTSREVEVLRLLATGHSNKEIAQMLGLRLPTVERHVANVYLKIDARGRADATAYAIKHGLAGAK